MIQMNAASGYYKPCMSAKEPYMPAKEPYMSAKEPYMSAKVFFSECCKLMFQMNATHADYTSITCCKKDK